MKKIITAINNPNLNEKLREEEMIEIVCKDFQYKEAIIEYLEKNNNVDLIIINEEIPGEIKLIELINLIKKQNDKIDIIIILLKENIALEEDLRKINIEKICYLNKITLDQLVEKIKKEEIDVHVELKNEISELKKMILDYEKNNKKISKVLCEKAQNIYKKNLVKKEEKTITKKIIVITGDRKVGKTNLALNIFDYLNKLNKKVCIVDLSFNMNLEIYLKINNIKINNNILINNQNEIIKSEFKLLKKYKEEYDFVIVDYQYENIEEYLVLNNIADKILFKLEDNILEIEMMKKIMKKIENKKEEKLLGKIKIIINKTNSIFSVSSEILQNIFPNEIYIEKCEEMNEEYLKNVIDEKK